MEQKLYLTFHLKYGPDARKSSKSLDVFKPNVRQWEPDCPYQLCKNYLQHAGFNFSIN